MPFAVLPTFRYHPDPIATGSIEPSKIRCVCCEQARGFIYTGPVYALDEYQDSICPWCIADGLANARLSTSFTDEPGIGGYGEWDAVSPDDVATIAYRTPGFNGWQQEQWWTHCGDAAAFLGRHGFRDLEALGADAIEAIKLNTGLQDDEWHRFYVNLNKDGSPTAYLFRCMHCSLHGGYQDSN
ncbi:CbrC family protein [Novosphingobium lindaniclasticum]